MSIRVGAPPGVAVRCIVVPWGKFLLQHPARCQHSVTTSCGDAFGVPRVLSVRQPLVPEGRGGLAQTDPVALSQVSE